MHLRILLSLLTVTSLAFAGCAGNSGGNDPKEGDPTDGLGLEATKTTGIIRGVVVDERIVPVADALVTLQGSDRSTRTTDGGAFGFEGLDPGSYFLMATKNGYADVQQSVDVVAGEADPPVVKVQLVPDPVGLAYATTEIWEGFVSCAATVGVDGAAYAGGHLCGEEAGSRFIMEFSFANGRFPTYVQDEVVWTSTQPLSGKLAPGYYRGGVTDWKGVTGSSPLFLDATEAELRAEETIRGENITSIVLRVFPGQETGAVVTTNQQFTVYHTTFYGLTPRPGYLFTVDGACEPAEKCT